MNLSGGGKIKVLPTHGDFFTYSTKNLSYIIMFIVEETALADHALVVQDWYKKGYYPRYIFLGHPAKEPYSLEYITDKVAEMLLKLNPKKEEKK